MEAYSRHEKSAVLAGRPGVFTRRGEFPTSNVVMASDRYSYEGNWLFCSFDHTELLAARVGFSRGKMDWRDYGLDEAPASENALFCRVEVVTAEGIYAHLRGARKREQARQPADQGQPGRGHQGLPISCTCSSAGRLIWFIPTESR